MGPSTVTSGRVIVFLIISYSLARLVDTPFHSFLHFVASTGLLIPPWIAHLPQLCVLGSKSGVGKVADRWIRALVPSRDCSFMQEIWTLSHGVSNPLGWDVAYRMLVSPNCSRAEFSLWLLQMQLKGDLCFSGWSLVLQLDSVGTTV